jgi:hypothetical protein
MYSENHTSVIKTPPPGLFSTQSLAGKAPKGWPQPEDTIVETLVCEEFDDGWGDGSPDVK